MTIKAMCRAEDESFQKEVKYYMQKAAIAVLGEPNGGSGQPSVQEHAERVAYAIGVLNGEADEYQYAIGVVTNATIKSEIDNNQSYSGDIEFVVNSMFSKFAGYDADIDV